MEKTVIHIGERRYMQPCFTSDRPDKAILQPATLIGVHPKLRYAVMQFDSGIRECYTLQEVAAAGKVGR